MNAKKFSNRVTQKILLLFLRLARHLGSPPNGHPWLSPHVVFCHSPSFFPIPPYLWSQHPFALSLVSPFSFFSLFVICRQACSSSHPHHFNVFLSLCLIIIILSCSGCPPPPLYGLISDLIFLCHGPVV